MRGQRLSALLGGVLVCFSGALLAGPETERPQTDGQVWGDPEEREEAEEGWTWFGMGYESRSRAEARSQAQAAGRQGEAGDGSQGRRGGSGRN